MMTVAATAIPAAIASHNGNGSYSPNREGFILYLFFLAASKNNDDEVYSDDDSPSLEGYWLFINLLFIS